VQSYHQVLDPYHTAFRIIRLLASIPRETVERDRLRLFDFYLVFPSLLHEMRLPRTFVRARNRVDASVNRYLDVQIPPLLFERIQPIHFCAIGLLASFGYIDSTAYEAGVVAWAPTKVPGPLIEAVLRRNSEDEALVRFLTSDLLTIPLLGVDGLKHRSGLMEYRYDTV
jgi:hypothetical protein